MHEKGYGPRTIEQACPHCGARELHDPRQEGETVRRARCRDCGEWYTVHEQRDE